MWRGISPALPDVGDQTGIKSDSTLPFVAQMLSSEAPVAHAHICDIWRANPRPSPPPPNGGRLPEALRLTPEFRAEFPERRHPDALTKAIKA